MTSVESAITAAIEPAITAKSLFLEALQVSTAGKHRVIRVLVDGDHPLSLDEVTAITKPISEALDSITELGERPFTLEVSSPGVDFPLTLPRHWRKNTGRLVSFTSEANAKISGRITNSTDEKVTIDLAKEGEREFALKEIKNANIEIEFK